MLQTLLTNIGFSEKEASIYLAGLEVGFSPASTIARKAGYNRVTTYGILNEFVKKGYASKQEKSGSMYFIVLQPEELVNVYKSRTEQLEAALPELMGLMHTSTDKPKMQRHANIEGVKQLYNSILSSREDFSVFLGTKDIHPDFHHFLEHNFLPRRHESPIKCRAIISEDDTFYAQYNKETHESVILPNPVFDIANEIIIYDLNKVAICLFSSKEMSATVIESKTFHDCMLGIFDLIFSSNN